MRTYRQLATSIALIISTLHILADVPGVRVSVQCSSSNVVLSWPSQPGETFTVLHRPTLNTLPWATLATVLQASLATNFTTFVHSNATYCPPATGSGGASGSPPLPGGESTTSSTSDSADVWPLWDRWIYEGRLPYLYELEQRPPYPWDPDVWLMREQQLSSTDGATVQSSPESGGSGSNTTLGFYRVYKTSPIANRDYFSVQQNSQTNQFSIFDNDFDPDDDSFLLSNVTPANNGTIQYTDDASIFHYTPTSGFFGSNSFTYTVTNTTGGRSTTIASIFVKELGNSPPTITAPIITLATNVYTATINPTNGATDPDGNAISFVAFTAPQLGTVVNNAGQLVYTYPTNLFGGDWFDYYLTDGRGGLRRVRVMISQADGENDGIADQWEHRFGLDATVDDSYGDPDGDSVPNLAEYKLGTHPRLPENPLNLDKVTVGQAVSNYARIFLSLNPAILKPAMSLLMNGDVANAFLQQAADGTWYFNWDTGYLTNGNYSLAASLQFHPEAQPPTSGTITGQVKSVRVTNEVIFDQLNSGFSHTLFIHLKFAYQPAEWRIEFYDEDGSGLVYFEGTDSDGELFGSWDLTDTGSGGQQIAFGSILAEVYVAPPVAGQGGGSALPPVGSRTPNARRWFIKEVPGGVGDKFVIAWGWHRYFSSFNEQRENLMLDGVINILANPGDENEYVLSPGLNAWHCCAFRYDAAADRQILIDSLRDFGAGNFFWFGHGSESDIAGNNAKSSILADDIENELQNKAHRSRPPRLVRRNEHPYRLVILNGCKTYSPGWANAFGIDYSPGGSTNIVFEYQFTGRSPRAYVGWTENGKVPDIDPGGGDHVRYATALAELFSSWMGGFPLDLCAEFFGERAIADGFDKQDKWKISGCIDLRRHDP